MARLVLLSLVLSVSLGAEVKPEQLDVDDATWIASQDIPKLNLYMKIAGAERYWRQNWWNVKQFTQFLVYLVGQF